MKKTAGLMLLLMFAAACSENNEYQSQQAKIDSAVNDIVQKHDAENDKMKDSILKAIECHKADSITKVMEDHKQKNVPDTTTTGTKR